MVRKTKKIVGMLLVLSLVSVVVLAGCGKTKTDSSASASASAVASPTESPVATKKADDAPVKKIKIRVMTVWTGGDANAPALQQLIKSFNEKTADIEIVDESVAGDAFTNKMKTEVATGDIPHIFQIWAPYDYAKNGVLLDMKPYFAEDKAWSDGFIPGIIDSVGQLPRLDGRYVVPMETNYEPFYYNTELFAKAGIAKTPETFDELLDAVKKLKAIGVTPIAAGAKDTWRLAHIFNGLVMKRVGIDKMMGFADGKSKFTDEDMIAALNQMKQLVDAGAFDKDLGSLNYDTEKANFFAGKSAMVYNGTWFVGDVDKSPIKDKVKVFYMPSNKEFPQFKDNDILYSGGFALSNLVKDEKEKAAMIQVVKYLSGKEAGEKFTEVVQRPPVRTDLATDMTKLSPLLTEITKAAAFIKKSGKDVPDFTLKAKMLDMVRNNLAAIALKLKTPEEVAKILQTEMDKN